MTADAAVTIKGRSIHITLPTENAAPLRAALRNTVMGCSWDAKNRIWKASPAEAVSVTMFAAAHNLTVADDVHVLAGTLPTVETDTVTHTGLRYEVHTTPGSTMAAHLAETKWAVRHKDTTRGGYWTVPSAEGRQLAAVCDRYLGYVPDTVTEAIATRERQHHEFYELSVATTAPQGAAIAVTGLRSTLMPLQPVSAILLGRSRRMINADEQGLGKTLQTLATARLSTDHAHRLLIVCPSSLTRNWVEEMSIHFDAGTFTPHIASGHTPTPIPDDADTVVIGWAVLPQWAKTLAAWVPDMAVYDEGHYAKSGKKKPAEDGSTKTEGSHRGTAFITTANAVPDTGRVLVLTGTPVVNRPLELLPILEGLGVLGDFGGEYGYKHRYCGPKRVYVGGSRGYAYTYTGHSNLDELNTKLRSSGNYLRRTKRVLIASGDLQRKYVDGVDYYDTETPDAPLIVDGSPAIMSEYAHARADIIDYLINKARDDARARDERKGITHVPPTPAQLRKQVGSAGAAHLRELGTLRKIAATAKQHYIHQLVRALVDNGEKVVIAAHHREVVDDYANAYTGLKIQGGMTTAEVERQKHLFNTTPVSEHPVLVLSVEAGKTGHTLCKQRIHDAGPECARMVLAEQLWTPADEAQVQDRIWRIGQSREVRVANVLVRDSVDVMMYNIRATKKQVVDAITDGIDHTSETAKAAAQLAMNLYDEEQARRGVPVLPSTGW